MFSRFIAAALCGTLLLPAQALAEDLAVILSNLKYRSQDDLGSGPGVDRIERALINAGFSVVTMQNMDRTDSVRRLDRMANRMERADRLVVVLNGHLVTGLGTGWLLVPKSERPTPYSLGASGLPVDPFLRAAATKPGAGVVVLVDQNRAARVQQGVLAGYEPAEIPHGVTVLSGGIGPLAAMFEGPLLEPGVSYADALAASEGVSAAGFVGSLTGLLPQPTVVSDADEGVVVADPELSPEELLAQTESDLGLSRSDRRRVQQSLAILGFDPRGIDGVFGRGSRGAIRAYQTDRGLPVNGFLNQALVDRLFIEADQRSAELEEEARQRQAERDARDTAYWRDTGKGRDETGLRAYLNRYPDGIFSAVAKNRLELIEEARRPVVSREERRFWERADEAGRAEDYQAYLTRYPDGAFAEDAAAKIEEIEEAAAREDAARRYRAEERQVAGNSVARKLVENRLAALGYNPGRVDGEFDEDTRNALAQYQEARGLRPTGYVNQATMLRILVGN